MTKTEIKEVRTKEQAVKRLVVGDRVLSSSGKILTVSLVVNKGNRTIVLFDGDLEVDFEPYFQIRVVQ